VVKYKFVPSVIAVVVNTGNAFATAVETNAVVASCNVFVPAVAVGAVGTPVNTGLAKEA
jgi:hypothetical protein